MDHTAWALDRMRDSSQILAWMEEEGYEYARFDEIGTAALVCKSDGDDGDEWGVVAMTEAIDDFTTELIDLWEQATAIEWLVICGYDVQTEECDGEPVWRPRTVKLARGGAVVHTVVGASTMTKAIRDLNRAVYMDRLMSGEVKSAEC